jgi:hypothetical protein
MDREDIVSGVAKVWDRRAMENELTQASVKIMAQHVEIEQLREANELMLTDIRRTDVDMLAFKAEIERLRAALKEIEYLDRPQVRGLPRRVSIQKIAAAALEGK